jgi:hypothetical protein
MTQQRVSPVVIRSQQPAVVTEIIQGASGQSVNLWQVQNSSGTVLLAVNSAGQIAPASTSSIGLVVKGLASQTGNLQEWQNSSGTILTYVDSSGIFYPDSIRQQTNVQNSFGGTPIAGVILTVKTSASGNVGLIVQGSASQSVDLQRWRDSTPTVLARVTSAGAITSAAATAGIGYETGAGGTATQGAGSGKSTAVTLSKVTGQVTMNNAALAANTTVSFVLTNTAVAATDVVHVQHISGGTLGAYTCTAAPAAGSATIYVRNVTAGSLSEAIVLQFVVIKAVTA